ncbi:uncharacterized protein LOC120137798 [Hibiscus syriacus]|uniref:uncharacterized protein LOC120137798 n=1 Tax=Hibiscus syriacus TaxID=106335 RepID=UPI00192440FC|nr:uncharacterized protein LOC120137798 [Hibiscus syriacus]
MDWRNLFGCSAGQDLEFFPPSNREGIPKVQLPSDVFEAGISEWKLSLVGQFLGASPNFVSAKDHCQIMENCSTRFSSSAARDCVLENGPWHIINKPLILRKWKPNLRRLNFDLSKIPVWVKLFNVPLELYSRSGLSYIASAIGVPLSMDSITASKSRLEYAKVCVEIGVNDELPKFIDVVLRDGQATSVSVDVPWIPSCCRKCMVFGHSEKGCPDKTNSASTTNQVWIKKGASQTISAASTEGKTNASHEPANTVSSVKQMLSIHKGVNGKESVYTEFTNSNDSVVENTTLYVSTADKESTANPVGSSTSVHNGPSSSNETTEATHPTVLINSAAVNESTASDPAVPNDDCQDTNISSTVKQGRGKQTKDYSKVVLAGSKNRYAILNSIEENPAIESQSRKVRTAALGVITLLNELKKKKNDHLDRSKNSTAEGSFQGAPLIITATYGSNDGITRRLLWHQLREIDNKYGHLPWILGGDFNIILNANETSDCELLGPISSPKMKDFLDITQELSLHDHPYFGLLFTWSNKQQESFLARKLNRVLINPLWAAEFQNSFVEFLAPGPSDHCMALVWLNKEVQANRPKPFKFFNFWTLHPSFNHEVQQSWQQAIQGNPMQVLFYKLKRLKGCLKRLNIDCYSDISTRVKQKKSELELQQLSTLRGDDALAKELTLQNELKSLKEAELMFLKQKAKAQWLKEGDRCTKFFHSIVAAKNKRDTIRLLVDERGSRLESFDDMASEVINYFKSLIGTEDPAVTNCDPDILKDLLQYKLPIEATSDLVKGVSTEDIKTAIFNQGNDKAQAQMAILHILLQKMLECG